jgi:dTDP-4-dehydrorhamnose 3,5-epimerase
MSSVANIARHLTPLLGVQIVERKRLSDDRGSFERLFCIDELAEVLGDRRAVQVNRSVTNEPGTVRGMHFQIGASAEMKIITCLCGKVFDVAVDLREKSPTRFQWFATFLSGTEPKSLVIPEGFGHGFQVIEGPAELLYFHTQFYDVAAEGGLHPEDPILGIKWPLPVINLSAKDSSRSFYE